ncbi:glycosyltransferase family 4 protein [Roseivivax isoporae]|uniref:Glycosyl transferase n=1 Tax=Roseivivax isoporae LMG 25204 TaxID=1449351 RepID=X7F7M3_9RHOB|nr:glycosyltransferase family 4 protein [Roseivivax isoporae]ETX28738.1 glycosyl transferase [Roseivivax isoporae LMG 25204]
MKVLLVGSEPVDHAIAYANGLAPQADVQAILPRTRYEALLPWIDPRLNLDLIDWPRTRSLTNPAFLWALTRRIRAFRPDVVHVLSNTTLWLNAAVPFWRPYPVVTTVHDVTLHPGDRDTAQLPGWGARMMARQSGDLVVHGDRLRRDAAAAFSKPLERVHVLSHPAIRRYADLAREKGMMRAGPAGEVRVLLFGRIFAYKGLSTLIKAEALLDDLAQDVKLIIAGRGDDPWAMQPLMGRPERYDIRQGFVPDEDVARLFTDADIVVLPYDEASQSGVLHLAATFGKPVIVTDVGELRATVEPNGIGRVVPPGAPAALARAIRDLVADPCTRAAMGRRARLWSEGPNAPETVGRAAMKMYRAVTERRAGPPPN